MMRNQDAPKPMFESLESRQFFAATPAPTPAVDLKVDLIYTPTPFVRPGQAVDLKLKVTNVGDAKLKFKPKLLLNYYVSDKPTFPTGAEPFHQAKSANLNRLLPNASQELTLNDIPIPGDVDDRKFYLFVTFNENGLLKEKSLANNRAVSPALTSPIGTYSGPFAGNDKQRGNLTVKLSPAGAGKGMLADVTLRTDVTTIQIRGIRATVKPSGKFSINVNGTYAHPTLGRTRYRIDMDGKIVDTTYTGDARVVWMSTSDSRNTWDKSITLTRK